MSSEDPLYTLALATVGFQGPFGGKTNTLSLPLREDLFKTQEPTEFYLHALSSESPDGLIRKAFNDIIEVVAAMTTSNPNYAEHADRLRKRYYYPLWPELASTSSK